MSVRRLSALDRFITQADQALRTVMGDSGLPARPSPATGLDEPALAEAERRHAARLMRVNHAGEVAAQALYQGQAATAKLTAVRDAMDKAADEENDHLAWCAERIRELGGDTSLLNPLWYAGSFTIGALAGLTGDKWSLGFVAETERQVVEHLGDHMSRLPRSDARSQAILERMSEDEAHHGHVAMEAGGAALPAAVKRLMSLVARVMTRTAYWL